MFSLATWQKGLTFILICGNDTYGLSTSLSATASSLSHDFFFLPRNIFIPYNIPAASKYSTPPLQQERLWYRRRRRRVLDLFVSKKSTTRILKSLPRKETWLRSLLSNYVRYKGLIAYGHFDNVDTRIQFPHIKRADSVLIQGGILTQYD